MNNSKTIIGNDIFFNFIEINYQELKSNDQLLEQIISDTLDGFVVKNIFSPKEIQDCLSILNQIPTKEMLSVPTGFVFPLPFATITNSEEKLDNYIAGSKKLQDLKQNPAIANLLDKLDMLLKTVGNSLDVSIPKIKNTNYLCSPGNFRIFPKDKGGLFVHCGYLFQKQAPFYYQTVEQMDLEGQLSYFIVLQNSEEGGELTIYDMLWPHITEKDNDEDNEYVLAQNKEKVFLNTIKSFYVKPNAGDILIFKGGPIWHRVENIKGDTPRITFGGFLNLKNDKKAIRYWS